MNRRYTLDPQQIGNAVSKAKETLSVDATFLTWCAVHGSLQMALRHPHFPQTTRTLLEPFIEQLGKELVAQGFFTGEALRESIELEQRFNAPRIRKD